MHFMEEIGNDENYLDEPEEKVKIHNEDEGYCDEAKLDSDDEDVEIIQATYEEQEESNLPEEQEESNLPQENPIASEYWIHEKVSGEILNKNEDATFINSTMGFSAEDSIYQSFLKMNERNFWRRMYLMLQEISIAGFNHLERTF